MFNPTNSQSQDIALVRLERPMPGMGGLTLPYITPTVGSIIEMSGTGLIHLI